MNQFIEDLLHLFSEHHEGCTWGDGSQQIDAFCNTYWLIIPEGEAHCIEQILTIYELTFTVKQIDGESFFAVYP
jgi:hypothetical protein